VTCFFTTTITLAVKFAVAISIRGEISLQRQLVRVGYPPIHGALLWAQALDSLTSITISIIV
jgi:hypothetical protein